jgi:predicted type IV restriction endonuclease
MDEENQISVSDRIINTVIAIQEKPSEEIISQLTFLINELINKDFNALIQLLYRIDVNEQKLKTLLKQHQDVDTSLLIADLIIERQLQKIATKKYFDERGKSSSDDSW